MRLRLSAALFLFGTASFAAASSAAALKDQLMVPPSSALRYSVVSNGVKQGAMWQWRLADGRTAFRHSQSIGGIVTETDAVRTLGRGGLPAKLEVRGFNETGDQSERFAIGPGAIGAWSNIVERGSASAKGRYYLSNGGPGILDTQLIELLAAKGRRGLALLPSGHAALERTAITATVRGQGEPKRVRLAFVAGLDFAPFAVWLDDRMRYFASVGTTSVVPEGFEDAPSQLRPIQDRAVADRVRRIAHTMLTPAARRPVLIDNVLLFDALGRFVPGQSVLISDGKIARVGPAGTIRRPRGTIRVSGKGRTLVPGLWDAHRHLAGDWGLLQNLATGIVNYRSPGTPIDRAQDIARRRASGDLIAPDGKVSVIVDRKDPLAAQGTLTVSSAAEAVEAVRRIKSAGMWGVKFYTSMDPDWIAPAAAEAHRIGLYVHGHVPAGMRPLEAVRAGYDELTHLNFVIMQFMPKEVVDKSNTPARLEGPARYAKDLDLAMPDVQAFVAELARRKTAVDPTLVVFESLMTMDGGVPPPAYRPFIEVVPANVARGYRAGGYPLFDGLTRDDFRMSFLKLVEMVGILHRAGVPIVAGTDGEGLELVRELELYRQAGMTNAEALQTATLWPARITGMTRTTGSIVPGKDADLLLVDGDVSKDLGALRHVAEVYSDGYRLDGAALRKQAGFSGAPR